MTGPEEMTPEQLDEWGEDYIENHWDENDEFEGLTEQQIDWLDNYFAEH